MKKLFALALAALMVLSMAACSAPAAEETAAAGSPSADEIPSAGAPLSTTGLSTTADSPAFSGSASWAHSVKAQDRARKDIHFFIQGFS